MYIDLRAKLEMYRNSQQNNERENKITGPEIHEILEGNICKSESGAFFLVEKKYPLVYTYGNCSLAEAIGIDYTALSKAIIETPVSIELDDIVFLDTETTGLSGGTGTVAFLIGIGYFEKDSFVLKQYFMRDYDEEYPMLKVLNELLSTRKVVVTFNGKAFDWNLLQTRYTSNRLRIGNKTPIHLDLLYPSRILWKSKLENCRLSTIEERILKLKRVDDIPGALIPSVYFKYLEDRNATEIKKVITHNEKDILSMVSLIIRINILLFNPLSQAKDAFELFGIGRIFEKREKFVQAMECYTKCATSINLTIKELSLKRLAFLYRRNKDFLKAVECLEDILGFSEAPNILVKIELAKLYEHRMLETEKALNLTLETIALCSQVTSIKDLYDADLKVRLDRLARKVLKINSFPNITKL